MSYLALATDYDGTIATEGTVDPTTLEALQNWRRAGRQLILITGRELDDWLKIFPQPSLFDWVVAENGAVLYHPVHQSVTLLTEPPPEAFVQKLRERIGAGEQLSSTQGEFANLIRTDKPLSMGRVIVATWQPYDTLAQDLIQEMGVDLQVILNKRAVMILPRGVDKALGLKAALAKIDIAPEQVVGVGDAENDSHFLALCGYAVAVANALPAIKAAVDWVTPSARGAGVTELIEQLLQTAA